MMHRGWCSDASVVFSEDIAFVSCAYGFGLREFGYNRQAFE
jgi:hypothetical protein